MAVPWAGGVLNPVNTRSNATEIAYSLNKPEETAAALRGGWMHTDDGAYMDEDGFVFIVDWLKDMIVSGGENVYSAEVENTVTQHPAVATCAVIGIPSEKWGEAAHAVSCPSLDRASPPKPSKRTAPNTSPATSARAA